MRLNNLEAEVFIPDKIEVSAALGRTTALCIAAHHDDIEIMAYGAIAECFGRDNRHFAGVVVTDGDNSPRGGVYVDVTNDEMRVIRAQEQKNAARIGRYSAQFLLAYPSSAVKAAKNRALIDELKQIILTSAPDTLYMHNLADKHDTHVGVALYTIAALREIEPQLRPHRVIAMEVWRTLDWLCDADKVAQDTSMYPNLAMALIGLFDSQISGGKRYDLAIQGRRLANATFLNSHAVDVLESASIGLDMTDFINSDAAPAEFILGHVDRFKEDVAERISRVSRD